MNRLRQLLLRQEGVTLPELLVVVAIVGVLLAVAVPMYVGFSGKANDTAGAANTHSAAITQAGNSALAP